MIARADLLALLSDVEAYLSPRSEASEADRPNEAMRLLASVSNAHEALEKDARIHAELLETLEIVAPVIHSLDEMVGGDRARLGALVDAVIARARR